MAASFSYTAANLVPSGDTESLNGADGNSIISSGLKPSESSYTPKASVKAFCASAVTSGSNNPCLSGIALRASSTASFLLPSKRLFTEYSARVRSSCLASICLSPIKAVIPPERKRAAVKRPDIIALLLCLITLLSCLYIPSISASISWAD